MRGVGCRVPGGNYTARLTLSLLSEVRAINWAIGIRFHQMNYFGRRRTRYIAQRDCATRQAIVHHNHGQLVAARPVHPRELAVEEKSQPSLVTVEPNKRPPLRIPCASSDELNHLERRIEVFHPVSVLMAPPPPRMPRRNA